ncbi:MAG TPA: hypothetical protein VHY22_14110, partial [Chthoniobacteraceae bacterium]|nr:hypothetical protein [Chthoniobacteraceae bacterium]
TYGSVTIAAFQSGTSGQPNYGQLNLIAYNSTYEGGSTPSISFQAAQGATYVFSVGAQGSENSLNPNGSTTLSMITQPLDVTGLIYSPLDPSGAEPSNDDFENARNIYGNALYVIGYNGSATTELGEPESSGSDTLWYRWTAQATGTAAISTLYSTFDDQVAIYTGTAINQLSQVGGTVFGSPGAGSVLSTLSFSATANTVYHIAVGSQSANQVGSVLLGLIAPGSNYFPFTGPFTGFPGSDDSDFLSLTVSPSGSFTGKAIIDNRTISLAGALNSAGNFQKLVDGITFRFFLDPTGASNLLTGVIIADGTSLPFSLQPAAGAAAPPPARYTVLIRPDPSSGPQGFGAGTLLVRAGGKVTFSANLADGTPVTASGVITTGGTWNLYVPLYKNAGVLSGAINFQQIIAQSDFAGDLLWIRPSTSKISGFTASPSLLGSAFSPGIPALNLLSPATAAFFGGALSGTTSFAGLQQTGGSIKAPLLSLSVNKSTGIIAGKFTPSGGGKPLKMKGVVFQDQDMAAGYVIDAGGNGAFTFGD